MFERAKTVHALASAAVIGWIDFYTLLIKK
jgi:hypothetical protein